MRLKANAAYVTDVGRVRSQNQDAAGITQNPHTEWPIFILADGMGGHAAGEIAASLAVQAVSDVMTAADGPSDPDERLLVAIEDANQRIHAAVREDRALTGMGTTCLVALLAGQNLHLGHVGDSRAYIYCDGRLEQVTSDHSWVNEQVKLGLLAPAEAPRHPMRHVITRALGPGPVEPDLVHRELGPGDWLLLCSDGLTGPVDDGTIERILAEADHPEVAARRLVELANQAGGQDNVTVLLVHLEVVDPAPAGNPAPSNGATVSARPGQAKRRSIRHPLLVATALLLLTAAVLAAVFFLRTPTVEGPLPPLPPPGAPPTPPAAAPIGAVTPAS